MARFANGWVKISRSLCDGTYDAIDIGILFWLICNANYADGKSLARGGHKRVIVPRGTLVTSVKEMESALSLARGLMRSRLKNFVAEGILAIKTTNTGSHITICNYDKYQSMEGMEEPTVEPSDNHRTTIGQPSDSHILKKIRNKERKNNTPNKNHDDESSVAVGAIVSLWNETLTGILPPVSRLTDKRKRHINAQLKIYTDMNYWADCFRKVKESDFLTGKTTNWKCTFDWVLNENNRTKIIEGNYANKESQKQNWEEKVRWV